jgi:hypothetical protein
MCRGREAALNESKFDRRWDYRLLFPKSLLRPLSACVKVLRWTDPPQHLPDKATDRSSLGEEFQPRLKVTLERTVYSLPLVIHNSSTEGIWVREVVVNLAEVEVEGDCYRPPPVAIRVHAFIEPSDSLAVCLIDSVYNAVGRPRGAYTCVISPVVRCRKDVADEMPFDVPCAAYFTEMEDLSCTRIRRIRPFEASMLRPRSKDNSSTPSHEHPERFRRSKRVNVRSAVVIEGTLSDGTTFVDMTYALVLSAHGCLATATRPMELGKQLILRNLATNVREPCRVVYVEQATGGETRIGLGFENEVPDFWGAGCLPAVGAGWSDAR